MFRQLSISAAFAALLLLTGCASVVNGHTQSVSVTTLNKGVAVTGARCAVNNDKGAWFVTSPGSVTVQRSFADLKVDCALAGTANGTATAPSATTPAVFGNILVGGVIGAGVDIATGAAYSYPNLIPVEMGRATVVKEPAVPGPAKPGSPPATVVVAPASPGPTPATAVVASAGPGAVPAPAVSSAMAAARAPVLNDVQQARYQTFLTRPLPRAFAISANGHYASTYSTTSLDKSLPSDPKERALLLCSRLSGMGCALYAVDNELVYAGRPPDAQPPGVRTPPGRNPVDPALAALKVPHLNDGQQAEYQTFLTQPFPRAFAVSDRGHYATAWSNNPLDKSMSPDPRERALAFCRTLSGQNCRLYLVDNQIVYANP